jgi:hypothetical protein
VSLKEHCASERRKELLVWLRIVNLRQIKLHICANQELRRTLWSDRRCHPQQKIVKLCAAHGTQCVIGVVDNKPEVLHGCNYCAQGFLAVRCIKHTGLNTADLKLALTGRQELLP